MRGNRCRKRRGRPKNRRSDCCVWRADGRFARGACQDAPGRRFFAGQPAHRKDRLKTSSSSLGHRRSCQRGPPPSFGGTRRRSRGVAHSPGLRIRSAIGAAGTDRTELGSASGASDHRWHQRSPGTAARSPAPGVSQRGAGWSMWRSSRGLRQRISTR